MRKSLLFAVLWLCAGVLSAQLWSHKIQHEHATDCTTNVTGKDRQLCVDLDDGRIWRCEPATGDCDTAPEWKSIGVIVINDSITFDGAIDLITSSNGDIDLSPNGTGETNVNSALNTQVTGAPTIAFVDDDTEDNEDTVTLSSDCTAIGTGAENCDLTIQQYISGTPTDAAKWDASEGGDDRLVLPDSSIGPDEIMATGKVDGYALLYESTGDTLVWAAAAGGAFDNSSDPIVPYTPSKRTEFGDGAGTLAGKVEIGGMANEPTLVLEAHGGQTADIFVAQNDADTEMFTIAPDGTTTIAGSTSTISGSGTYVEIDDVLYITPVASPPIACTDNAGIIYHDDSGTLCICDGASSWVLFADYGSGACS